VRQSAYAWPIVGLWLAWLIYWVAASRNVKDERRHESLASGIAHLAPMFLGAALLAARDLPLPWLYQRFLPPSFAIYGLGVVILAAGLAVAVWARHHLGRNWSGIVTLKQDHELIRSGPYRLVRHPIYSGLLLAVLGTAIAIGEWRGLVAFLLILGSFLLRLRMEERFMDEAFHEHYARYRAKVPALIPRIFRGGPDTGA
jgi:protein-S-isoprenylcysteine O-methyltransferase Ste14